MSIKWSTWHAGAFARARAEAKPVLLSISAAWCRGSREMDRTSYADPDVQRLVNDRFIPVRVDADRRPDIAERYGLGGLPTTAFLTADGALVTGGTFVSAERMRAVLEEVARAVRVRGKEMDGRSNELAGARSSPRAMPVPHESLLASVFHNYDADYGGFGTEPKFPLTAPLHLALNQPSSSVENMLSIVEHTLDAMAEGGLYDGVDGGFFRCATRRDWQFPRQEKLLDVNAGLLRVLLDAAVTLNVARYRDLAADVIRYVQTWLADPVDGGWAGSQEADELYYSGRTHDERARLPAPRVDSTLYAGWNGTMVSAALHAAHVLQDPDLGEFAIKSLERMLLASYQPGGGVAHYVDGQPQVRGLLDDQIMMARAALDAAEATGSVPYEMIAEELALHVLRTMWDEQEGGVFDRGPADGPDDIGLLQERVKPFVANCEAARLFIRLDASSGNHEYAERARATIASVASVAAQQGPLAAHYLLAVREAGLL